MKSTTLDVIISLSFLFIGFSSVTGMAQPITNLSTIQKTQSQRISCFEYAAMSNKHNDQYFELNCQVNSANSYFHPSNWSIHKTNGDGGVDVTGIPNFVLVEGADTFLVDVEAAGGIIVSIPLPADGFLAFDWSFVGNSNSNVGCSALINDKPIGKLHYSPTFYAAGDLLTIQLQSTGQAGQFKLSNLEFLTDAIAAVKHPTPTGIQLLTIERPIITDVIFPKQLNGVEGPMLTQEASTTPFQTGFPYFDLDGDLQTSGDQFELQKDAFGFQITWQDEVLRKGIQKTIIRHWTIIDTCSGSEMIQKQLIKQFEFDAKEELNEKGFTADTE
ncbi:MAG: hypothetical protein AAF798_08400 [Bacteroidota bacterium]